VLGTCFKSVSTEASNRDLDWEAVAGFFSAGYFPHNRTYYKDTKVLEPATEYIFSELGELVNTHRYWDWPQQINHQRSFDQTVLAFADIFHEITDEQTRSSRIAIPISGGLDSRTIASCTPKLTSNDHPNHSLWAYSYGYSSNSIETKIARKIAETRGFTFDQFTIEPYLFRRLDQIMASMEGFNDVTICRQAAITNEIAEHADYVIGGHLGDLLLDDAGMSEKEPGSWLQNEITSYLSHKLQKTGGAWLLCNIVQPQLRHLKIEEYLENTIFEEYKNLAYIEDYDYLIKAFKVEHYCFRFTATGFRMFQAAAFPRLPFYDTRLVDFICTIPAKFLKHRRLQIEYLKRYAPDLARIPWQVYDANLYWYKYFNSLLIPKRAAKKIYRRLSGKPVLQRNWEVQFLSPDGKENLQQHLLSHGLRILDYVEAKEIQTLLEVFYINPQPAEAYTICMLLTFAAWLERYG